jgi:acyl-CoA thioester hydrolase
MHCAGNLSAALWSIHGVQDVSVAVAGFRWPVRVYYEDTDSGGVVYYANYLRFMERARTEWMRSLGFEQDTLLEREGLLFAVRSASLEFLKPARFNDLLSVSCQVIRHGRASLGFEQLIVRDGPGQDLLCSAQVRIACLDAASFLPRAIPEYILKEIADVR